MSRVDQVVLRQPLADGVGQVGDVQRDRLAVEEAQALDLGHARRASATCRRSGDHLSAGDDRAQLRSTGERLVARPVMARQSPAGVPRFWKALGLATKVPLPWILKISPSFCRSPSAWRTVMRLTLKGAIISLSDGICCVAGIAVEHARAHDFVDLCVHRLGRLGLHDCPGCGRRTLRNRVQRGVAKPGVHVGYQLVMTSYAEQKACQQNQGYRCREMPKNG